MDGEASLKLYDDGNNKDCCIAEGSGDSANEKNRHWDENKKTMQHRTKKPKTLKMKKPTESKDEGWLKMGERSPESPKK